MHVQAVFTKILKDELGLDGSMVDVVRKAAGELGIEGSGKTTRELAEVCVEVLGGEARV